MVNKNGFKKNGFKISQRYQIKFYNLFHHMKYF